MERFDDAVDHAVLLRLLGREVAVALEVERDLGLVVAGVLGVDLLEALAQRDRFLGVDRDVGRLALEAA